MVSVARPPAGPAVREWARKHGYSDWMVARYHAIGKQLETQTGEEALPRRILDGLRARPPKYVRVNPLRSTVPFVRRRLEARGFEVGSVKMDPHLLRLRTAPISPGATYEHLAGMTTPQDMASASAPLALGARPRDTVADLAAAPGVKTLHIAGDMRDEGAIVACEPDEQRHQNMSENLERGGVSCAVIRNAPAQELPGEAWADRVLVDAPCTGEGTLPKDRNRRRGKIEEIAELCQVQSDILAAADRILRPGGTLVYATCALAPEENEGQVQDLVNKGYAIQPVDFGVMPGLTAWPGLELDEEMAGCQRFFPGIHPSLGFFVAKLRKEAA